LKLGSTKTVCYLSEINTLRITLAYPATIKENDEIELLDDSNILRLKACVDENSNKPKSF
jgi:hypothetical protein